MHTRVHTRPKKASSVTARIVQIDVTSIRITFTASAHLALASDCVAWCDFDSPLMMKRDPVHGGIRYGLHGTLELPGGIGFGASIERDALLHQRGV